ncbi:hypothetical protein SpCBS45565_g02068 [Spizellomyces sp. 'palustris']|nr:hypothetical protein SpCBS45565_g02068 [Spizellomyces sp. 'palustris']
MDHFSELELTASGRPVLSSQETISVMQKDVGLYEGKVRLHEFDTGIVFVTTHRLLWVDETRGNGLQLPLTAVKSVDSKGGIWKASSPKITLTLAPLIDRPKKPVASSSLPVDHNTPPPVPAKVSTWICDICQQPNTSSISKCELCGVHQTKREQPQTSMQSPEVRPSSHSDSSFYSYPNLQKSATPPPSKEAIPHSASNRATSVSPTRRQQKGCPVCTFLNHPDLKNCELCDAPLPGTEHTNDVERPQTHDNSPQSAAISTPPLICKDDLNNEKPYKGIKNHMHKDVGSDSGNSSPAEDGENYAVIKLSFRGGGMSEFLKALKSAVSARAWKNDVPKDVPARPVISQPVQGPNVGGIASIMRSVEQSNQLMGHSLDEAFSDLNALMAKAADMVKLAESISTKLAQGAAAGGDDSSAMATFRSYLVDLGIHSPVTREAAGDLYINELARQLAEFLEKVLKKHTGGGMIALTDVYCLFNRARGVALISPQDLRKCCNQFEILQLPYRIRQFDSGLLVVQAATHSDEETARRVHAHVKGAKDGLKAVDLAPLEQVSVVLAVEQLLLTESRGLICRDDTVEGLRFFDNIITNYVLPPLG